MDDLRRLRIANDAFRPPAAAIVSGGSPAFVGQVTTASPAVGKFLKVNPVVLTGAESEGGAGTQTVDTTTTVVVLALGPAAPVTGDFVVCRFVDYRWVTEQTTPGGVILVAPCNLPTSSALYWHHSYLDCVTGVTPIDTVLNYIGAIDITVAADTSHTGPALVHIANAWRSGVFTAPSFACQTTQGASCPSSVQAIYGGTFVYLLSIPQTVSMTCPQGDWFRVLFDHPQCVNDSGFPAHAFLASNFSNIIVITTNPTRTIANGT
jgi:hypothetical protein